ncbi:hypothetical protein JW964_14800 [candidate division KSB1 bacterium]|nr:hypothetical protein [candidate division KSB1 bacterium]
MQKKLHFILLLFLLSGLIFFGCSNQRPEGMNRNCPYSLGDHLEYENHSSMRLSDGTEQKDNVFIILEVIGLEASPSETWVKLKRYYTDRSGTVEDSLYHIYSSRRVLIIRPDNSRDSLSFELGNTDIQTLADFTDSAGFRHTVKLIENSATVTNTKNEVFKNCIKIVKTIQPPKAGEDEFVYKRIAYYKDTILIKYLSVDNQHRDEGIEELLATSELTGYKIDVWR